MNSGNKGFAMGELLIWAGLVSAGVLAVQVKVSTHWRQKLLNLQTMRIPYTGRGAR